MGALVGAGIFAGGVCAWLMRVVFLSCVWGGRVGDGVGGALAAGCAGGRGSAWWGVGGRRWVGGGQRVGGSRACGGCGERVACGHVRVSGP